MAFEDSTAGVQGEDGIDITDQQHRGRLRVGIAAIARNSVCTMSALGKSDRQSFANHLDRILTRYANG